MKVLVIGSGAREHALIDGLLSDDSVSEVVAAPGNAGIAQRVGTVPVDILSADAVADLAVEQHADLVVVGPEAPLVAGVADAVRARGIACFGPSAAAARLEGSKAFAKQVMAEAGVPTAMAHVCTTMAEIERALDEFGPPYVVKDDGLAAGKGVVVTTDRADAVAHGRQCLSRGNDAQVVVEEYLDGEEVSLFAITDGSAVVALQPAQDFKRVADGDTGPNTGGMGTYSPAEVVTPEVFARIENEIVRPSVNAIADEGIDFRGTLFIGIMLTAAGPSVIEYNARFGDPETQVVLPRLASDLLELLWRATRGELAGYTLKVKSEYALCVVIAAQGYPESYPKGDVITIPPLPANVAIIHAGTARNPAGELVTNGGRVLGVTARGATLRNAARDAYAACAAIQCASKYYRRDIGARQLNRP